MLHAEDPFHSYHRARWWMTLARVTTAATASAALVAALSFWVSNAPPGEHTAASERVRVEVATAPVLEVPPMETPPLEPVTALPEPAPASSPQPQPSAAPEPGLPITGTRSTWSIVIDTTGYQAEIDRCLWVRMELGAVAPIIGAHNYCGGGVVLEMSMGESVTLTGTGLGGEYTVVDMRDARAGENAATATSGLDADVILQTCYWENDGRVKLVALALG